MGLFGPPNIEKLKAKGDVEGLIKALSYKDPEIRKEAIEVLGKINNPDAVEPLIQALKDEYWGVRWYAVRALGKIGEPAVGGLIQALKNRFEDIPREAAEALGKIGEPAVESLIKALDDKDEYTRGKAAVVLGEIGTKKAVVPLINALSDKDKYVRKTASQALGKIGDPKAVDPLIKALREKGVRRSAASALKKIGTPEALNAIAEALNAITKDKIDALIRTLTEKRKSVRLFNDRKDLAKKSLKKIGKPAVEPLITAMKDCSEYELSCIIDTLGEIGDTRAVEPIVAALKDDYKYARASAADALGKIGDALAVKPLIQALKDEDETVRLYVVQALGKITDARSLEPLITALKDEDCSVREMAATELGILGDSRAIEPLIDVAINDNKKDVREEAKSALEKIDKAALKRVKLEVGRRAIKLKPDGKEIYDLMNSGKEFNKDNPITLKGVESIIYCDGGRWVLVIPTYSNVRKTRKLEVNIGKNPDKFVFDVLKDAPNWRISTTPEGRLYKLMNSEWVFDFDNPIIIGDLAYVYYDTYDKEWYLRIPVSPDAEKIFNISKIFPINKNIDKAIIDAIAAVGLSLT